PGFSWYNWNDGSKNEIPRRGGQHLWEQVYYSADLEFDAMYVAMFDEYDEATAIAKAAEDDSMTPGNQYFLTLNEDGIEMSSDFYLRLTGAAGKMIKGEKAATYEVPIPYFE
ncbi:MAG: xylosidase, partial [Halanaerobiales bacterium]